MFGFATRRARRDYRAALKVLKHACVSARYRDTPAARIGALEALRLWHDDKVEAPDPFATIAAADAPRPPLRVEMTPSPPEGYELPEQADLVAAAVGLTRNAAR